jgi:tyrosine-protein phosphatase SIW14
MKFSFRSRFILLLIFTFVLSSAAFFLFNAHRNAVNSRYTHFLPAAAEKLSIPGIRNAGKVSEFLYRGAQPRGVGYRELQNLGISIVVDLRNTGKTDAEQKSVESSGMRNVSIPTSAFFGPTDNQVAAFLQLLRDNPGKKIFVHCYFGDDRTGVIIASYRIAEDHWTADQAYNEMLAFHFHRHLLLMGHYVKFFPANFAISPAFQSLRDEISKASVSGL